MKQLHRVLPALLPLTSAGTLATTAQTIAEPAGPSSPPSADQATAYYPALALASSVSGTANLRCDTTVKLRLTNCKVISESPAGWGFGDAALKVADSYPDNPKVTLPHPTPGEVSTIRFSANPISIFPPPGEHIQRITNPDWAERPTAKDLHTWAKLSPAQARGHGSTLIQCLVDIDGHLYSCKIGFEFPAGSGYGDAGLRIAARVKMKPQLRDGEPVGGAKVSVPFQF